MSTEQKVIKHKVGLLRLAEELGNVSRACKVMGYSRDTFYLYEQAEARMAVFEWLEGWYNPHRRHSSINYLSPIEFERRHLERKAGGLRPPDHPFILDPSEGQDSPGLESGHLSTEPR
jgi:hypothetical protein